MKTEARFLLAIVLMLGVLVGTNLMFPPIVPDQPLPADSLTVEAVSAEDTSGLVIPEIPQAGPATAVEQAAPTIPGQEEAVTVLEDADDL